MPLKKGKTQNKASRLARLHSVLLSGDLDLHRQSVLARTPSGG